MGFSVQQLSDLEEIRQLKHKYFRCIDTGNWAEIGSVFADDVEIDYRGGGYRLSVKGKADMVEFLASNFNSDVVAMHMGHTPEIEFTGQDSAKAKWYLEDRFINPERNEDTVGTAIYYDQYIRTAEGWKLKFSEYDRVWELVKPIDTTADLRTHMLAETGRKPGERADMSQWLIWYD